VHGKPVRYLDGLPQPDRCLVMGVLNVTPDSFSDGGQYLERDVAVKRGLDLLAQGADIVDVGGESTRPGAARPSLEEEKRRVLPVVAALAEAGVLVSVDTMRAEVAHLALDAGAGLVNDVSGGQADDAMFEVVARHGAPYVLMHWRGHADQMTKRADYTAVVDDVLAELAAQLEAATRAGIAEEKIALDPGIGFAKTADHNWALLHNLERLHELGRPVLVANSRKRFLGLLLADEAGDPRPPLLCEDATTATSVLAAAAGVWCVRTHSAQATSDALRVVRRWADG
jgi:dihydropteroate synthase